MLFLVVVASLEAIDAQPTVSPTAAPTSSPTPLYVGPCVDDNTEFVSVNLRDAVVGVENITAKGVGPRM